MARINRKTLLWVLVSMAALCISGWFTWRAVDTSVVACDPKHPIDAMRVVLWNPFRDRAPERAATLAMRARVFGDCEVISLAQTYCSPKEPIGSWRITGESKNSDRAWVRVWVDAQTHDGRYGDDALYIALEREGKGWKILSADWSDACGY
jgi:hypothetical protein